MSNHAPPLPTPPGQLGAVTDKKVSVMFLFTRPKPAYGQQGLDWDRWARIQFGQVLLVQKRHVTGDVTDRGIPLTSFDPKDVTSPTGISN